MSDALLFQQVAVGPYPERVGVRKSSLDELTARIRAKILRRWVGRRGRWEELVEAVSDHGGSLGSLDTGKLRAVREELVLRLRQKGFHADLVARSFALIREVADRVLGQRHYDVQLVGGWILLQGQVAEMEAGEGKTLTATLAAATAALAGVPVHVITVNDYLAARDAEWMGPVYRALGLRVGTIIHGMDPAERRAAYAADVTYCTNKEIVFDYLRDRLAVGRRSSRIQLALDRLGGEAARTSRLVLRGLHYGIVDEADSVLIDEARTPLIISGEIHPSAATERTAYETALSLADRLEPDLDYRIEERERMAYLTEAGQVRLSEFARGLGEVWGARMRREELVQQALTATHFFKRDKHYLVNDGKVQIIDEYTGRVMEGRSWERGLHQLIEAKEKCAGTQQNAPMARISYQRFFRRYLRLAGMTGTAREVTGELGSVYGLAVVRVPTNQPLRRRELPGRAYASAAEKWKAMAARVVELHSAGRPTLVGTRSVEASEHVSRLLEAQGLPHTVLNARQDKSEAEIVAQAGEPGRITVATNMAGRGTDIRLIPGVAELGGLHVIATERHEAGRIDRQLFGRCGRQGDPGTYEAIVSLEDELVVVHGNRLWRWLAARLARPGQPVPAWLGDLVFRQAQRAAERTYSRTRHALLEMDEHLDSTLAFSGRGE
ncbi:MAG TPA: preprotein translocase subunit SecA [Candidatus Methylomirabilis sp.]|nr:preprotein translocase subunit SecA [Candidatus Methylomirabilis sp.]